MKLSQYIDESYSLPVFYHGTSDSHIDQIMKEGLINPYLTDLKSKAEYYAKGESEGGNGTPMILEVKIPDRSRLRIDMHELDEPVIVAGMDYQDEDEIRDIIEKEPQSTLNQKNYQFSLLMVNSVRYDGRIPPENIKKEYL